MVNMTVLFAKPDTML